MDPAQVGRFAIQGRLGAGAMGIVLVGRDDTLDREVAIKLVKPGAKLGKKAEAAKLRLLREAQAMAKIAHPNVVAVYEAGLHEDGVYIAMELVKGQALDAWLVAAPRSVPDILERFLQAGRGLAAAHAKGIIHRDFKPANVLIGDDGRARVGDFGLARASASADDSGSGDDHELSPSPSSSGNVLAAELTHQGAMLGSPAFMSLEAFKGKATALSDQWSFGASLYGALYGESPFAAENVFGLYELLLKGARPKTPANGVVPPRITAAVLKALAHTPEERFPSMDALVSQIAAELGKNPDHDPERSRKQRRKIAIAVTCFGAASRVVMILRTDYGLDMTVRDALIQASFSLVVISGAAFAFRNTVLRDEHGRRLTFVFFLLLAAIAVHRFVAVFSDEPLLITLRGDAIIGAALAILASVTLERWLGLLAALFGLFLLVSFAAPVLAVAVFGMAVVGGFALAIYFWRDDA